MVVLLILVFLVFLNRAVAEIRPASSQIAMENRRRGRATAIKDTAQRWRGEGELHSSKVRRGAQPLRARNAEDNPKGGTEANQRQRKEKQQPVGNPKSCSSRVMPWICRQPGQAAAQQAQGCSAPGCSVSSVRAQVLFWGQDTMLGTVGISLCFGHCGTKAGSHGTL